jgi:hypothetical protein
MIRTLCLAATTVLALALPAAAQSSRWTDPAGQLSATLPPFMTASARAMGEGRTLFSVSRNGAEVGSCLTSVVVSAPPPTQEVWDLVIKNYTDRPTDAAMEATTKAGHAFVRFQGVKAYRSTGDWAGYVYWFERTNKDTQLPQTAINAGAMLDGEHRFIAICSSIGGNRFTDTEINGLVQFMTTARYP